MFFALCPQMVPLSFVTLLFTLYSSATRSQSSSFISFPRLLYAYPHLPSYDFLHPQLDQEPLLTFLSWFWKPYLDELALLWHLHHTPHLQPLPQPPLTAVIPNSCVLKELGLSCDHTGQSRAGKKRVEANKVPSSFDG